MTYEAAARNRARVDQEKVTGYLLCTDHPDGRTKAEFLQRFGFRLAHWESLVDALLRHGRTHAVVKTVESPYGVRYAVDGALESPDGRNPLIRTVWILEQGSTAPRPITAHPLEETR